MRPVNAADDGASSRPLAENTEAMRRWSLVGAYRRVARGPWRAYTRGPAKGFFLVERSCGTDARGQRDRQRQRDLREAGAWGASEKRAFSELQLTGLRLARRKQEGGPALRASMFIYYFFDWQSSSRLGSCEAIFSRPLPLSGGLDLDSRNRGCARLGSGAAPPLSGRSIKKEFVFHSPVGAIYFRNNSEHSTQRPLPAHQENRALV